jgi:site-specific recombinase XerD
VNPDEVKKLLAASRDPEVTRNRARDFAILTLMYKHGLRVSELCEMKLRDINVDTKILHVNRLKDSDSGSHELVDEEPKAVRAWLAERAKIGTTADTFFVSERRKPMARTAIFEMIKKIAKAAGLEAAQVHPHMLRHSTGFFLINNGVGVRTIQDFLGHKAITSTVRYTKLDSKRFKGIWK